MLFCFVVRTVGRLESKPGVFEKRNSGVGRERAEALMRPWCNLPRNFANDAPLPGTTFQGQGQRTPAQRLV